ncbi:hypothetical protein P4910_20500 [Pantoea stewartii]|uniref:gp53-like domain-containing protein n=1 Tax=Pantoea stewartii TaxID=66269 RepID=UPI0023FA1E5F|nr:hypothetical protein [Pantoea stewartii]MDF7787843.1 hypothetical protein [Pantoea stewartii]
MATNNFKPFATAANANVTGQSDYEALPALGGGFQSGKASSAQINKALRQGTVIASLIGAFLNAQGQDAKDDGNLSQLLQNFTAALNSFSDSRYLQSSNKLIEILNAGVQAQSDARSNLGLGTAAVRNTEYFLQMANNLYEILSAGSGAQAAARSNLGLGTASVQNREYFLQVANNLYEILSAGSGAQAAARSNLGLGSASTRTVGTTGNQIPDMTNFASSTSAQPYQFFPTGLLIQAGYSTTDSNGNGQISFAQSFVSGRPIVVALPTATSPSNYIATVGGVSNSGCTVYCTAANAGQTPVANAKIGFNYIAFGY